MQLLFHARISHFQDLSSLTGCSQEHQKLHLRLEEMLTLLLIDIWIDQDSESQIKIKLCK